MHELNSPLVAIKMGLEHLKQNLPVHFEDLINPIVEAGGRALFLMESIYRIYQGTTLEKTFITPLELKGSLEKLLSSAEGVIQADIQFEIEGSLKICTNLCLLTQVLFNLVKNAHAAFATGGVPKKIPIIHIQMHSENGFVVLLVRDNGPGLPLSVRQNPFKPFHKRQVGGGLGLGLYLSHLIILALSGRIEVTTEEDVGTEFRIYLK